MMCPARGRPSLWAKAVGMLVYLAVTPFVALFLAIFAALLLQAVLLAFEIPPERAGAAFPVLLIPPGVLTAGWAVRDFRRRVLLNETSPPFIRLITRRFGHLAASAKPPNKTPRPPTSQGAWDGDFDA